MLKSVHYSLLTVDINSIITAGSIATLQFCNNSDITVCFDAIKPVQSICSVKDFKTWTDSEQRVVLVRTDDLCKSINHFFGQCQCRQNRSCNGKQIRLQKVGNVGDIWAQEHIIMKNLIERGVFLVSIRQAIDMLVPCAQTGQHLKALLQNNATIFSNFHCIRQFVSPLDELIGSVKQTTEKLNNGKLEYIQSTCLEQTIELINSFKATCVVISTFRLEPSDFKHPKQINCVQYPLVAQNEVFSPIVADCADYSLHQQLVSKFNQGEYWLVFCGQFTIDIVNSVLATKPSPKRMLVLQDRLVPNTPFIGPDPFALIANIQPFGCSWFDAQYPDSKAANTNLVANLAFSSHLSKAQISQHILTYKTLAEFEQNAPEAYKLACKHNCFIQNTAIANIPITQTLATDVAPKSKRRKLTPGEGLHSHLVRIAKVFRTSPCIIATHRQLSSKVLSYVLKQCLFPINSQNPIYVIGNVSTHSTKNTAIGLSSQFVQLTQ